MNMKNPSAFKHLWPYMLGWAFIITSLSALPFVASFFVEKSYLLILCWMMSFGVCLRTSQWALRWLNEEYEDFCDQDHPE